MRIAALEGGPHPARPGGASGGYLGHTLGPRAVAEGIDTPEQARRLEALGCRLGQGFLFSRPLEATALTALLSRTAEPAPA